MFDYVLCWLITFGISWSIANADGPFAVFVKLRKRVQDRYGEDSWQDSGMNCPICVSLYVSVPVTILMNGDVSMWLSAFGFVTLAMTLAPD